MGFSGQRIASPGGHVEANRSLVADNRDDVNSPNVLHQELVRQQPDNLNIF
jgi:hypothetical protein